MVVSAQELDTAGARITGYWTFAPLSMATWISACNGTDEMRRPSGGRYLCDVEGK